MGSWVVSAEVRDFEEATEWFLSKTPTTQDQLDALDDVARARAFTIAGSLEIHAVQVVFDEVARSLKNGTPIEEFKRATLEKLGPGSVATAHLETVFINNVQQAYNTGRWQQMNDPDVNAVRPFRIYDSVLDGHTTQHCKDWDGVIRAWDDPCWQMHAPQCHHRCRAQLRNLRPGEAARRGLTEKLPESLASTGFGLPPDKRNDGILRPLPEAFDPEVWKVFESREFQAQLELELELQRVRDERLKRDADNDQT